MANLDRPIYDVYYNTADSSQVGGTIILNNPTSETFTFQLVESSPTPLISFSPLITSDSSALIDVVVDPSVTGGIYTLACEAWSSSETLPFTVRLNVTDPTPIDPNDPNQPQDPNVFEPFNPISADRYHLKYKAVNNGYTMIISELDYIGSVTEVTANFTQSYASRKGLIKPIIPSSLEIELDASIDLSFQDLYSESENTYRVEVYKGVEASARIFYGFLKPDDIVESYTSGAWTLKLDAMDGLSTLKNLSFLRDDGLPFARRMPALEIVRFCLRRIGFELPILVQTTLPKYTGLVTVESVLAKMVLNTDRYYKNDKEAEDCEAVLSSILSIFNATILQRNGVYVIFRPNDMNDSLSFHRYNIEYDRPHHIGVETINVPLSLGSQIDGFFPHHDGMNQEKSISPTKQSITIDYELGQAATLYKNENLETTTGLNAEGWTINGAIPGLIRNPIGRGIRFSQTYTGGAEFIRNSDPISVVLGDSLSVTVDYSKVTTLLWAPPIRFHYVISTDNFVYSENGWIAKPSSEYIGFELPKRDQIVEHTIEVLDIPEDGSLTVVIKAQQIVTNSFAPIDVNRISILPLNDKKLKSIVYNAQRISRKSSALPSEIKVYNGDSISFNFYGTLEKDNGDYTSTWNRLGVTEEKELLTIAAEDYLSISPRPMVVFSGSVFGAFDILANVTISNISGKFQVVEYSRNFGTDVTEVVFEEFDTLILSDDIHTERTLVGDNVVNVRIKS